MRIPRQWADEQDVFNAVAYALEQGAEQTGELEVDVRDEEGGYGERGTLDIWIGARRFRLDLNELCD